MHIDASQSQIRELSIHLQAGNQGHIHLKLPQQGMRLHLHGNLEQITVTAGLPESLSLSPATSKNPADVAALSSLPMGEGTVETTRSALVGKIGENMSVRRFVRIEAKGKLVSYVHGGAKVGVLVDIVGGDEQLGKDIAMHIAASKPKALDASGVSVELLDTERRIAIEKARADNKPEAMLEKIAEGTVQKFLKEVTLLAQVFVKAEDGKQTIEQLLKAKGASVAGFTLYVVGEGLEKRSNDFAAEVAAQAAAAQK